MSAKPKNDKDLEEELFDYTRKNLFGEKKERTLEDAFEEALELKPKKKHDTDEGQWI